MNPLIKSISVLSMCFASTSFAAITNPVVGEQTIQGAETPANNTALVVNSGATLNVGSSAGSGSLTMTYDAKATCFTNNGTLNIGTDTNEGIFTFTSNFAGTDFAWSPRAFINNGTINIQAKGTLKIAGRSYVQYGDYVTVGNMNVYGKLIADTTTNSYLNVSKALNIYTGGSLDVKGSNLSINNGGSLNFLGGTYVTPNQIRMTGMTGGTIYMGTANVIKGAVIQMDGITNPTKGAVSYLKTADCDQTITEFRFGCSEVIVDKVVTKTFGSETYLTLSQTKDVANYFKIEKFAS